MNELRIFATSDGNPSDETKQAMQSELESQLKMLGCDAQLNVTSGEGSFWIVVSGFAAAGGVWLLSEFASWAFGRVADKLADQASDALAPSRHPSNQESMNRLMAQKPLWQGKRASVEQLVSAMDNLAEIYRFTRVVVGVFDEDAGLGRIVELRRRRNDRELSFVQMDSQDEFNSRTSL